MISTAPKTERRAAPRVDVQLRAHARYVRREATSDTHESVPAPTAAPDEFDATIADLSINGAKLLALDHVPPLLARLELEFTLPDYGTVEAIGIVMWRRTTHFIVPPQGPGAAKTTSPSFGVLFESIQLGPRLAIHDMVMGVDLPTAARR